MDLNIAQCALLKKDVPNVNQIGSQPIFRMDVNNQSEIVMFLHMIFTEMMELNTYVRNVVKVTSQKEANARNVKYLAVNSVFQPLNVLCAFLLKDLIQQEFSALIQLRTV